MRTHTRSLPHRVPAAAFRGSPVRKLPLGSSSPDPLTSPSEAPSLQALSSVPSAILYSAAKPMRAQIGLHGVPTQNPAPVSYLLDERVQVPGHNHRMWALLSGQLRVLATLHIHTALGPYPGSCPQTSLFCHPSPRSKLLRLRSSH